MLATVLVPPPTPFLMVPGTSRLETPHLPDLAGRSPPVTRAGGATLASLAARLWKSGAGRSDSVKVSASGLASLTPDLVAAVTELRFPYSPKVALHELGPAKI